MAKDTALAPGVVANPERCSGEPALAGTRLPTSVLYERWLGGEGWPAVAEVYELDFEQWLAAVAFEAGRRYSRAALRSRPRGR